jgi:crossover junction endodeoxyribonuclease RusA
MIVHYFVPGIAKPQGSKRAFVNPKTNRAIIVEDNTKTRDWRTDVRNATFTEMDGNRISEGPVCIHLKFIMKRPLSTPKTKATPPAVKKPDLDKLERAILDALTGVAYTDDSQVTILRGTKRIAEIDEVPGVWITIQDGVSNSEGAEE